jgi:hypothetical protein
MSILVLGLTFSGQSVSLQGNHYLSTPLVTVLYVSG